MSPSFGSAWRSFWHTMTSNDRHASHDSPFRTGQHVPLNQSRHAPLTSIATSALESRADVTSPYDDEPSKRPASATLNGIPASPGPAQSPIRAYSPGMRTNSSHNLQASEHDVAPGEIQMQSFSEGAPPPPPVAHSWKKIDRWAEAKYEELYDQLGEGCTQNDVNELEHELDCSLPMEVRESLQIHDGQERGGRPTGIIFGCMLLDCEEIVQEWRNWRVVNEEYLSTPNGAAPQPLPKAFGGSSSSSAPAQAPNPLWRQDLLDRQDSQPPKAIQKAYAHPSWIPLARDWGGNNLAVDLAPGPMGKWGQVIIFGRDYDCKYVVARSWAAFLAVVADDLTSGKEFVDEESGELKLKEFKSQSVEPGYLDILRWRTDQRYGRKGPKRKPTSGLGLNTNVKLGKDSPYTSPIDGDRGRSPQRFPNRGPTSSPKTGFGVSSPLARVAEESPLPLTVHTQGIDSTVKSGGKLVEVPTPRVETADKSKAGPTDTEQNKENGAVKGLGVDGVDGMKSVEI